MRVIPHRLINLSCCHAIQFSYGEVQDNLLTSNVYNLALHGLKFNYIIHIIRMFGNHLCP